MTDGSTCPTCGGPLRAASDIRIDPAINAVIGNGMVAKLTPREFDLLQVLRDAMPNRLSKTAIMQALYAREDDEPDIKIIDVYVSTLRNKLKGTGLEIKTMRGEGYILRWPQKNAA